MLGAIVRNHQTKKLLGFYWASSIENVWDLVGEFFRQEDYEFAVITETGGAIYYPGSGERPERWSYVEQEPDEETGATQRPLTEYDRIGPLDASDGLMASIQSKQWI